MRLRRQPLPEGVIRAVKDPLGRVVYLTENTMRHIARRHPEMDGRDLAIGTAIERMFHRCRGNSPKREMLFTPNIGPTAWLVVIVAYDDKVGSVITAYGQKSGPKVEDVL